MYKLANGWTKEKVMARIKQYNQNKRAMLGESCIYQASDGNRCAVGCFIPTGHPSLDKTNMGVERLLIKYPELADYMPFDDIEALALFQTAHDMAGTADVYFRIQRFLDNRVR